jgi:triosephosphate isomerase
VSYKVPLVVGNWKMNTNLESSIHLSYYLLSNRKIQYKNVEIAILPPIPFISNIKNILKRSNIKIGAQNVYHKPYGSYTGKISSYMLTSIGCEYILVGHSERRTICKETDDDINMILKSIYRTNITPILCVGESKNENELNIQNEVIKIQLTKDLNGLTAKQVEKLVIAYEPIWAIGTGQSASNQIAQNMHMNIRNFIRNNYGDEVANNIRIIYGGSVNQDNALELIKCQDIDGFLVGTSSLNGKSFNNIIDICYKETTI